jgi:hypothetical protein
MMHQRYLSFESLRTVDEPQQEAAE